MFRLEETNAVNAEAEALFSDPQIVNPTNLRCRWQRHHNSGRAVFDGFDPVVDISKRCSTIASDRRIEQILSSIYNEKPCLFRDKLLFKRPGSEGYPTHQDFISGTHFPRSVITVVVALDAADSESGCIEVFPGIYESYLVNDTGSHCLVSESSLLAQPVPLLLQPGDVAIFPCFTPHRSGPNRSSRSRRHLYLSYNAMSDGGDYRAQHYVQYHAWLRESFSKNGLVSCEFR